MRDHPRRSAPKDRRAERGSALLLVPVGVLITFVLAAIAVDLAQQLMARNALADIAAAAANDAADLVAVQLADTGTVDKQSIDAFVAREVSQRRPSRAVRVTSSFIDVCAPVDGCVVPDVRVELTGEVDTLFARGLGLRRLTARARARAQPLIEPFEGA